MNKLYVVLGTLFILTGIGAGYTTFAENSLGLCVMSILKCGDYIIAGIVTIGYVILNKTIIP